MKMVQPKQTKINLKDRLENGELDLSMSDLQEVPVKDIALVRKATSLDLSNNRLTTLGKNFVTLTHIVKLDLSKNSLRELPENFGLMKQLKHLDLYSNQLSHLPLSFSELKALRWLDVKNNPLLPAIAQVAGPCLDTPQCQQCAKRVVGFLAQMKASVEEERNRRLAQRQKNIENAESANSANSKNDKKNKKNKNDKNLHGSKSDSIVTKQPIKQANNQPKVKSVKSKKSKGKSAKKSSIFKRLITAFLFSFILSALIMYTLSIKDPKRYDLIKETTSTSWNAMLEMLPPAVSEAINKTVEHCKPTVKFLQEKCVEGIDKAIELKDLLYQNETFASLMNRLNDLWSVVYIKINEIYRTIYFSLTNTTKNK